MKKIIYLTMAVLVAMVSLSSCGEPQIQSDLYNPELKLEDTGGLKLPISDGKEEVVWSVTSENTSFNDSYVANKLREATGVNLKFNVYQESTAAEKIKVLAASKKLPDIIGQGIDMKFANDLASQGALAAVEDYIDVLPNFKRTFVDNKERDWIFKTYAAPDGKLYGFFGWDWNRDINTNATMYRKDIFDKHGLKMWNGPEEFYKTAKKLKELYPDSTPYTTKSGDNIFKALSVSWGLEAYTAYYNEDKKIWLYSDVQPEYKKLLDFVKKCYNEGLIDPEFLTNTQAAWTAKMTQADKAFITTDWIGRMEMFKEQTKDTVPDYDLRFGNPIGPVQVMREANQLCWARFVSNNDKAETAFKVLDFVLSPAGTTLVTMGVEGETYEIGDNGMSKYIEFPDKVPSSAELSEKYGMFTQGLYLSFDRRSAYFNFSEREQEAQDFAKDPKHLTPIDPEIVFEADENERRNTIVAELEKAAREFSVKYVLNNGGDKEWKEWLKNAEKLGYKELEKIYNDAQKRYDAM